MISHSSLMRTASIRISRVMMLSAFLFLQACSSGGSSDPSETAPALAGSDAFDLVNTGPSTADMIEGNVEGMTARLQINRDNAGQPIRLSARGASERDSRQMRFSFSNNDLTGANEEVTLHLFAGIDALPIQPQQRTIIVSATDGASTEEIQLTVNLSPTSAPDIYLLAGQSNMVGFSGDGTKDATPGGPDEINPRIKQLHVTFNDEQNFLNEIQNSNINRSILAPAIITAEDPLHEPLNGAGTGKAGNFIGLGLSFAKAALENTTAEIILVPAAWSGSAFCDNNEGPAGQWNANNTEIPSLGNTWLFDRAVSRTNEAIERTGGVLRGILWHQGESDANERCSQIYLANLERLAQQFRLRIDPDTRGGEFRRADSPIPFIVGTMSRGFDERGDLSVYTDDKQLIDDYHRQIPAQLPFVATSVHDDLVGDQWPCGNTTCIHFGAEALREIGNRYYQQLLSVMSEFR